MPRTKDPAQAMRELRAARKRAGLREFRAWVDLIRYKYLTGALDEPLCQGCGREEAECSADPCEALIEQRKYMDGEYDRTH